MCTVTLTITDRHWHFTCHARPQVLLAPKRPLAQAGIPHHNLKSTTARRLLLFVSVRTDVLPSSGTLGTILYRHGRNRVGHGTDLPYPVFQENYPCIPWS